MKAKFILLAGLLGVAPMLGGQQAAAPAIAINATTKGEPPVSHSAIIMSAMCDGDGNVYSRPFDPQTGMGELRAPVQEITREAKPGGRLPAEGQTFFVRDGRVFLAGGVNHGVVVAKLAPGGSAKAQITLQPDLFIHVTHLAVFPSGEYLVVGLAGTTNEKAPHLRTPFTAVFAADGRLVKKIYEPEDEDARQRAEAGDPNYLRCCASSGNEFVMLNADVTAGSDGNVYLMHGTSPPLIYVISPAGDVLRKFRVDPGNPQLTANSIKFYDGRLAVGFGWLGDVPETLIKVVGLKGNSIADYKVKEDAKDSDPILACYNSEGFTLLPRWAGTKPYLLMAKLP